MPNYFKVRELLFKIFINLQILLCLIKLSNGVVDCFAYIHPFRFISILSYQFFPSIGFISLIFLILQKKKKNICFIIIVSIIGLTWLLSIFYFYHTIRSYFNTIILKIMGEYISYNGNIVTPRWHDYYYLISYITTILVMFISIVLSIYLSISFYNDKNRKNINYENNNTTGFFKIKNYDNFFKFRSVVFTSFVILQVILCILKISNTLIFTFTSDFPLSFGLLINNFLFRNPFFVSIGIIVLLLLITQAKSKKKYLIIIINIVAFIWFILILVFFMFEYYNLQAFILRIIGKATTRALWTDYYFLFSYISTIILTIISIIISIYLGVAFYKKIESNKLIN